MLTIFTPTYNRKSLLKRLYSSLENQTSKDFEWIIVDDGSSDNTAQQVNKWIFEDKINIKYFHQENSGKHVAHNNAVAHASGEIFVCVDSDDFLASDSIIEEINAEWDTIKNDSNCAGIISLKALKNGEILGAPFPVDIVQESPFSLSHKLNSGGERNLFYRTEYIKNTLYPVFEGEKFCPDSFISDKISNLYKMLIRNHVDVLCEYQPDGLSNNFKNLMKNNPKGFCVSNMQIIDMEEKIKDKIWTSIRFWAFKFLAKESTIVYTGKKNKTLVYLCLIPGCLFSLYYRLSL